MKIIKRILWAVSLLILCGLGTCAAYYLPSTEKVQLTGTEVRRYDPKPADRYPAQDVRYIQARRLADDQTLVFRNDDTRWGWPPYFKFDAADLSAQAANIVQTNKDATVLITYYGIRSRLLDVYPNAVSLKTVERDYTHVPIFNVVFLVVAVGVLMAAVIYVRRVINWAAAKWKSL